MVLKTYTRQIAVWKELGVSDVTIPGRSRMGRNGYRFRKSEQTIEASLIKDSNYSKYDILRKALDAS